MISHLASKPEECITKCQNGGNKRWQSIESSAEHQAQRKALIRNQVTALLNNGKIVTTEAKAKEIRKVAEGLIALAVREKDNFEDSNCYRLKLLVKTKMVRELKKL